MKAFLCLLATASLLPASALADASVDRSAFRSPVRCTPDTLTRGAGQQPDALTFTCREPAQPSRPREFVVLSSAYAPYSLGPDNGTPTAADPGVARQLLLAAQRYQRPLTIAFTSEIYGGAYACHGGAACVQSISLGEEQRGALPPPAPGSAPPAPQTFSLESAACVLTQVQDVAGGIKLFCAKPTRGIDEFVFSGSEAALTAVLARQAQKAGRPVSLLFAFDDKQPGVADCRLIACRDGASLTLHIDPVETLASSFSIELLSYYPPRIEPYDALYARENPVYTPGVGAANYIGIRNRITVAGGRVLEQCALDAASAKNILGNEADDRKGVLERYVELAGGVSKMVADAKAGLIKGVASAVPGCGTTCQAAMSAGLDIALVAAGIPPGIPNVQEILAHGAEGLATQVIKEAAGQLGAGTDNPLLDLALDEAAHAVKEKVVKEMAKGIADAAGRTVCPNGFAADGNSCKMEAQDPFTWAALEPAMQPFPAVMYVRVRPKQTGSKLGIRSLSLYATIDGQPYVTATRGYAIDYVPDDGVVIPMILLPMLGGQPVDAFTTVGSGPQNQRLRQWAISNFGVGREFYAGFEKAGVNPVPVDRIPAPSYVAADSRSSQPQDRSMLVRFMIGAKIGSASTRRPTVRIPGKPAPQVTNALAEVAQMRISKGSPYAPPATGAYGNPERRVCRF